MGLAEIGTYRKGGVETCQRGLQAIEVLENDAAVAVSFGMTGVERDGLIVTGQRGFQLFQCV